MHKKACVRGREVPCVQTGGHTRWAGRLQPSVSVTLSGGSFVGNLPKIHGKGLKTRFVGFSTSGNWFRLLPKSYFARKYEQNFLYHAFQVGFRQKTQPPSRQDNTKSYPPPPTGAVKTHKFGTEGIKSLEKQYFYAKIGSNPTPGFGDPVRFWSKHQIKWQFFCARKGLVGWFQHEEVGCKIRNANEGTIFENAGDF